MYSDCIFVPEGCILHDEFITGCDDCEQSNAGECNHHGALHIVSDSPVLSRAQQSLPTVLEFRNSEDKTRGNNMPWQIKEHYLDEVTFCSRIICR